MPFFTDLDSRAAVRGSRDPLGIVPLWSAFGRTVVGNLTTVSNSVRGFTTLLLGYYFVEQLAEREGSSALECFLKFEQLAGYCRWGHGQHGQIRGIDRVKRRLSDGKGVVTLSADLDAQILANQRTYGLWGLFSGPARKSALVVEGAERLTEAARELVERRYLPALTAAGDRKGQRILGWLAQPRAKVDVRGRDGPVCAALAVIHGARFSADERALYARHLLYGAAHDCTEGVQSAVATGLAAMPRGLPFDLGALRALSKLMEARPDGEQVQARLRRIDQLECLLVPANALFEFALARHGQTPDAIAKEVTRAWGERLETVDVAAIEALRGRISAAVGAAAAVKLIDAARALGAGDYAGSLEGLLEHNAAVMASRGGSAAWARIESGRLEVSLRDESSALPDREQIRAPWRSTYFLNSLHAVEEELRG